MLKFQDLAPDTAQAINAAMPVSPLPNPAARPFRMTSASAQDRANALTCLTQAVYYESASEQIDGQRAVAQVIVNRVRNPAFPNTVCGVVYQGAAQARGGVVRSGCQFSFACEAPRNRPIVSTAWDRAQAVARDALNGGVMAMVGDATHYHTVWVTPYWSPALTKIGQIGAHIFYRPAGQAGLPTAFQERYVGGEAMPNRVVAKTGASHGDMRTTDMDGTVALDTPVAVTPKPALIALAAPTRDKPINAALPTLELTASPSTPLDTGNRRSATPSDG
ncbi:MAG: cell wall hydrolase [Caulobacteraceae bacterium]